MKILLAFLLQAEIYLAVGSDYSDSVAILRTAQIGDYQPEIRPYSTVQVNVGLSVVSLSLDSGEETMSVNGRLTVIWTDNALAWSADSFQGIEAFHVKQGEIWSPELVIENMVDDTKLVMDQNLKYRIHYSGRITWEPAINVKVHCTLDYTNYPFDTQRCGITVSSGSFIHSETPLSNLSDRVNLNLYKSISEWDLDNETQVEETQDTDVFSSLTYSKLTFYLTVTRNTPFYGLHILLPLVVLSGLSMLVFLLPSESGEKASYSVIILLAIVVYITVLIGYLPVSFNLFGRSVVIYTALVLILAALTVMCVFIVLYIHHNDATYEMTKSVKAVHYVLAKITCAHTVSETTVCMGTSEQTTSTIFSEQDLQAYSKMPNGTVANKRFGRLSPINRKVVPSAPPFVRASMMEGVTASDAFSPRHEDNCETVTADDMAPQPDRPNDTESVQTSQFQPPLKHNSISRWQHMAKCLDRLFFVVFAVLSFIVHFVFLMMFLLASP